MRTIWRVAGNDLRMSLQDGRSWLLLLAAPVVVIYLAGLGARGVAQMVMPSVRVDVLDRDSSMASAALSSALAESNGILVVCFLDGDSTDVCGLQGASLSPELANDRLTRELTSATIIVPQGFESGLEEGQDVSLVFQAGTPTAATEMAFRALQQAAAELGGPIIAARMSTQFAESLGIEAGPGFTQQRMADAVASWGPPPPVQVSTEVIRQSGELQLQAQLLQNGFKLSTPGVTAMFVMISVLGMTQSLAEERLLGILWRLGTLPLRKAQWLGGKLLSTCLRGLLQFVILLGVGVLLGVDFGGAPGATVLVGGAYVLAIAALAMALATVARTVNEASALSAMAWAVLVPLGGGWWPLALTPAWVARLGYISPVAWCLDGLHALTFHGGGLADVLRPVGVLLLFALVLFVVGVRRLDYGRLAGDAAI